MTPRESPWFGIFIAAIAVACWFTGAALCKQLQRDVETCPMPVATPDMSDWDVDLCVDEWSEEMVLDGETVVKLSEHQP